MDQIHTGLEPWDWEVPVTIVRKTDPQNGVTDYFSTMADVRAVHAEHSRQQKQILSDVKTTLDAFEQRSINNVQDGYWVQETYKTLISLISLMEENEERSQLFDRIEAKYETFQPQLSNLGTQIETYAKRQEELARQRAQAQAAQAQAQAQAAAQAQAQAVQAQLAAQAQAALDAQIQAQAQAQAQAAQEQAAAQAAQAAQEQAAAQAAFEEAQNQQTTQPETQPDYSAGPGAFQNMPPQSSNAATMIPQGPGGMNE